MQPPLQLLGRRLNNTLHGRSRFRKADVPGHNIFRGYNSPGHGDGIDWFAREGTVVRAIGECVQERHYSDDTKKEVIYLRGDDFVAVYAHINARYGGTGHHFKEGEPVGHVSGLLNDPHLHFELEMNGKVYAGATPAQMHSALVKALMQPVVYVGGEAQVDIPCFLSGGRLYVAPKPFAATIGLTLWRDGKAMKISDKSGTHFKGQIAITTTELDEPGVSWVKASDILKQANMSYNWDSNQRRLFIYP